MSIAAVERGKLDIGRVIQGTFQVLGRNFATFSVLGLVFYGLPWLSWGDRPAVLFDLAARRFYVFGLVLYHGSQQPERRPFHSLAAVIHIILGGSNLLFFDHAFGALDMRLFGLGITACHFGLVLLQALAAMSREGSRAALSIS